MKSYLYAPLRSWFLGLLLLMCVPLAAQPTQTVTTTITRERGVVVSTTTGASGAAYDPSQVLVRFRNGAQKDFLPGSGPARAFPLDGNLHVVPNPPGLSVAEAVRRYKGNPNVLYAEPDFVVQAVTTPTDPLWGQQWDMTKISAPAAWSIQTDASDVVVAVIDTGIDFTHPDLLANLWSDPGNNTIHGFSCLNGVVNPGGQDDFGHGTHVAGTIGAAANNGIGIAGLNWGVKLLSLKFLDSNGSGLISDAVLCFQKVAALKQQGVNIRVTNNSWGGGGFSQTLKDAMAAVEGTTVHACAAGNNGQNTDVSPMYPGAYDNRGIVSVLASDSNDAGAGFTNFGLASVDLAAPGVSTLSTVPTGACTLCDQSGYKLLSGTSMATPHVAGVLAALFHKIPALTAFQARDLILDPTSYDALADPKAQTTSTGGRLNFAKVLGHSAALAALNNFPVLTMGPDVTAAAGGQVNLTATATDADAGNTLQKAWTKSVSTGSQWLFGWMLNSIFPSPATSPFSFTAPSPARTATVPYYISVADGHGGGASGGNFVTVTPAPSPGLPPSGSLTVLPTSAPVGSTLNVSFPATDPEGGPVAWDVWAAGLNGASGNCCFTGSSVGLTFNGAGVWRVHTQATDGELNLSSYGAGVVVQIGGATGIPPIAAATLDKLSGPVPLTVGVNMGGSFDPDGTIQNYFYICGGGGFAPGSQSSQGSCTFTTPGPYWMLFEVQDNSGLVDILSAYVFATPVTGGGGGDTTPPTVSITSPTAGPVAGNVTISASPADNAGGSGVKQVDFRLDDPVSGLLLGTATTAPYSIPWDAGTTSVGPHTLYAIATDNATNTSVPASVAITVNAPTPPTVKITSPVNGGTVPKKAAFTIVASVTPRTYPGISRIDFLVGSSVVCSGTATSCKWQVPAAVGKTYQLRVNAYDTKNNVGFDAVTVKSK